MLMGRTPCAPCVDNHGVARHVLAASRARRAHIIYMITQPRNTTLYYYYEGRLTPSHTDKWSHVRRRRGTEEVLHALGDQGTERRLRAGRGTLWSVKYRETRSETRGGERERPCHTTLLERRVPLPLLPLPPKAVCSSRRFAPRRMCTVWRSRRFARPHKVSSSLPHKLSPPSPSVRD